MLKFHPLIGTLLSFGLLLSVAQAVAASTPNMPHESTSKREFQRIEQPSGVKLGTTAAGLALMGLELWWFLGSSPSKSQTTRLQQSTQELDDE